MASLSSFGQLCYLARRLDLIVGISLMARGTQSHIMRSRHLLWRVSGESDDKVDRGIRRMDSNRAGTARSRIGRKLFVIVLVRPR